ncbi:39610_t:CDS:1, partial [Gigaspora margarita]
TKNTELEAEVAKLRHDIEEIKKKDQTISNIQDALSTEEILSTSSDNVSNSNNSNELNVPNSDISDNTFSETKSLKDKEIEFLERVHKETVSNEIRERNRKQKLQAQNSILYDKDNSSCDIKTISQRNDRDNIESSVDIASQISNQQKTIPNTPLLAKDLDDSDEIELTKNQNIELDLI